MLVVEQAYYDTRGEPDRQTLRACALVCTSWLSVAQPMLFRHVRVPGSKDHRDLLAVFRTTLFSGSERARTLASYIRRAALTIDCLIDEETFVALIIHCPHLYELVLRCTGIHAFQDSTLEALSTPAVTERHTPIRALALLSCGIQSPILYQLLDIWPTVRFLRLGVELAAAPPPGATMKGSLYDLSVMRIPCIEGLGWLLSNTHDTLRIFECHVAPQGAHRELLAKHIRHLLSLRFFRHTLGANALLRQCRSLREVMFTQVSDFLPLGELPATVEHLTFRHFVGTHASVPPSIVEAVEKLPKLRLVSCDASAPLADNYAALEEKCRQKGVLLDHDVVPIRTVRPLPNACRCRRH